MRALTALLVLMHPFTGAYARLSQDIAAAAAGAAAQQQAGDLDLVQVAAAGKYKNKHTEVPFYLCLLVAGQRCAQAKDVLDQSLAKDIRALASNFFGISSKRDPDTKVVRLANKVHPRSGEGWGVWALPGAMQRWPYCSRSTTGPYWFSSTLW